MVLRGLIDEPFWWSGNFSGSPFMWGVVTFCGVETFLVDGEPFCDVGTILSSRGPFLWCENLFGVV